MSSDRQSMMQSAWQTGKAQGMGLLGLQRLPVVVGLQQHSRCYGPARDTPNLKATPFLQSRNRFTHLTIFMQIC